MSKGFQYPDDAAWETARALLIKARHGALGVQDDDLGGPLVTRVAVTFCHGIPRVLVSDLSLHTPALARGQTCGLMIGEPGEKGDPLTHPRLSIIATPEPAERADEREGWLRAHPKSALYIDFADFRFFRLIPVSVMLNAGFGKAYRLDPDALARHADGAVNKP